MTILQDYYTCFIELKYDIFLIKIIVELIFVLVFDHSFVFLTLVITVMLVNQWKF